MKKFICALSLILGNSVAFAAPITYTVSRTIGIGSVTGTIVTDGIIGTLVQADILGWTLLLNDGASTFAAFGPTTGNNSQVRLRGDGDFTATTSTLSFNYGSFSTLLFQAPTTGSGIDFWCLEGRGGGCTGTVAGEYVDVTSSFPGQQATRSGIVAFASVIPTGSVPEPETISLLGLGIVAFAAARRRRPAA